MPPLAGEQARACSRRCGGSALFEERVGRLKRADEVHGLIHLSIGQEGVAAAVCAQLRDDDAVYSGHRAHGHAIAKGAPLDRMMAELMGRDDGLCRGLGGSMHLVDVEHGFMGATGVVGGNIPIALGSALAARLRGDDSVAVVFFGDGAVQAGHFNETVNLATLWELPLILVCENNGFAEFTPRSAHTNVERVSDVVAPYDLERETVDGNDVLRRLGGVRRASSPRRATGDGPFLLECLTHRLRGHYEGDPGAVPRGARGRGVAGRRTRSCACSATASRQGWFAEDALAAIEAEARAAVEAAVRVRRARARSRRVEPDRRDWSTPMAETTYIKAITVDAGRARCAPTSACSCSARTSPRAGRTPRPPGLAEEFGTERVINTPISEAAITGVAIGAAQSGMRPVLEIMFIDFITLALDQLVNAAAKAHFMSGGQLTRAAGAAHAGRRRATAAAAQHSQSLESWLTHVPGLKVVMPSRAERRRRAARRARSPIPNPVVFIENKTLYFRKEEVPDAAAPVPIGEAATLRQGGDVTIVALSRLVDEALAAAERLAAEDGIEAEVIDPRTLVPLDLEAIVESVERTGRLVVAHEAVEHGGFGAEIAAQVQAAAFDYLDAPIDARRRAVRADPVQPAARGRLPAGRGRGRRGRRRARDVDLD